MGNGQSGSNIDDNIVNKGEVKDIKNEFGVLMSGKGWGHTYQNTQKETNKVVQTPTYFTGWQ